mmetsp:Transcript_7247/g.24934  ORF Transcript_7247/g.24934 Transcript_7247/m.24934 type:complete len:262 (-) Transcript_7247:372-1157(-)
MAPRKDFLPGHEALWHGAGSPGPHLQDIRVRQAGERRYTELGRGGGLQHTEGGDRPLPRLRVLSAAQEGDRHRHQAERCDADQAGAHRAPVPPGRQGFLPRGGERVRVHQGGQEDHAEQKLRGPLRHQRHDGGLPQPPPQGLPQGPVQLRQEGGPGKDREGLHPRVDRQGARGRSLRRLQRLFLRVSGRPGQCSHLQGPLHLEGRDGRRGDGPGERDGVHQQGREILELVGQERERRGGWLRGIQPDRPRAALQEAGVSRL